jgi:hypothetical protein
MDDQNRSKKTKYQAPVVFAVKLRPDEAVLANCKTSGSSGAFALGCRGVGGSGTCHQSGS